MALIHESRTIQYRNEPYTYEHNAWLCAESGEMYTTTKLDTENINQVYDQYRRRHGVPFPDEIKALRHRYGVSAAMMSAILGFGVNQYRQYEAGEVPSLSNARLLVAVRRPEVFADLLENAKTDIGTRAYNRIKNKLLNNA